jgi:hypothetical protein
MGLIALEEDVRDPQAYAGEDKIEQSTGQGLVVLGQAQVGVVDVFGERLVRAEV